MIAKDQDKDEGLKKDNCSPQARRADSWETEASEEEYDQWSARDPPPETSTQHQVLGHNPTFTVQKRKFAPKECNFKTRDHLKVWEVKDTLVSSVLVSSISCVPNE